MVHNRQVLKRGDGTRSGHAFGDWLRRQLYGDTGIGLDKSSLIFGATFFVSMAIAAIVAVILGFGTAAILAALSVLFVLIAALGGPLRSDLHMMAWFIQHLHIMMGICPIQTNVPQSRVSFSRETPGSVGSFYNGCSQHVPPIIDWPRKAASGSPIFVYRSSRVEKQVFPRQSVPSRLHLPTLCQKGLKK